MSQHIEVFFDTPLTEREQSLTECYDWIDWAPTPFGQALVCEKKLSELPKYTTWEKAVDTKFQKKDGMHYLEFFGRPIDVIRHHKIVNDKIVWSDDEVGVPKPKKVAKEQL